MLPISGDSGPVPRPQPRRFGDSGEVSIFTPGMRLRKFAWMAFKTARGTIGAQDGNKKAYGKKAQMLLFAQNKKVAEKQLASGKVSEVAKAIHSGDVLLGDAPHPGKPLHALPKETQQDYLQRAREHMANERTPVQPDPPIASTPTEHLPGSPGKIAEMAKRLRAGKAIFHPQDAGANSAEGVKQLESKLGVAPSPPTAPTATAKIPIGPRDVVEMAQEAFGRKVDLQFHKDGRVTLTAGGMRPMDLPVLGNGRSAMQGALASAAALDRKRTADIGEANVAEKAAYESTPPNSQIVEKSGITGKVSSNAPRAKKTTPTPAPTDLAAHEFVPYEGHKLPNIPPSALITRLRKLNHADYKDFVKKTGVASDGAFAIRLPETERQTFLENYFSNRGLGGSPGVLPRDTYPHRIESISTSLLAPGRDVAPAAIVGWNPRGPSGPAILLQDQNGQHMAMDASHAQAVMSRWPGATIHITPKSADSSGGGQAFGRIYPAIQFKRDGVVVGGAWPLKSLTQNPWQLRMQPGGQGPAQPETVPVAPPTGRTRKPAKATATPADQSFPEWVNQNTQSAHGVLQKDPDRWRRIKVAVADTARSAHKGRIENLAISLKREIEAHKLMPEQQARFVDWRDLATNLMEGHKAEQASKRKNELISDRNTLATFEQKVKDGYKPAPPPTPPATPLESSVRKQLAGRVEAVIGSPGSHTPDSLQAAKAKLKSEGFEEYGSVGDVVPFDRKAHNATKPALQQNPVAIVAPGWHFQGHIIYPPFVKPLRAF